MPELSKEIRKFPPSDPGPEPIHVGVLCPNTYAVAVASLGYQTLHRLAHSHAGFVTHRIVLENADGKSYPSRTLEEQLEIKSLAAIFVSCSFELDYIHLARILDTAGIPVLRKDRGSYPLVIAGGVALTANPEPLVLIADAISIGSGEITVPALLDGIRTAWPLLRGARFSEGREQVYEVWREHPGVYVPAHSSDAGTEPVEQASVDDPNDFPSYTPIISPDGVYGAKNLIEVSSGCPTGCRFCLLSYVFPAGPLRSRENIVGNAEIFKPSEASVGLVSSRISDHPDIVSVINDLASEGYEVSVSSLKISSTTRELLEALSRAGTKTATFAPEHGSEGIRKLICKPYSYEDVRARVEWAFESGIQRVKLYFITGFVEETESDVGEISEFVKSLARDVRLSELRPENRMIIGVAPFVPKAGTPFQRRPMEVEKVLKRKLRLVTDALRDVARVDVEADSPRGAIIQGAISIGDRSMGRYLEFISRTRGSFYSAWDGALRELGDGPSKKVLEGLSSEEALPWGFIRRPKTGDK